MPCRGRLGMQGLRLEDTARETFGIIKQFDVQTTPPRWRD